MLRSSYDLVKLDMSDSKIYSKNSLHVTDGFRSSDLIEAKSI